MIAIALGLAMQVGAVAYAAMPGVDSVPRNALTDSLRAAESRYLIAWRREWMVGRRSRPTYLRLASLHCHHDGSWQSGAPNIIRSRESARSFCPIWYPLDDSLPNDESLGVDESLSAESRKILRDSRAKLIERFVAGVKEQPQNPWLVGQLVRLAVDQDDGPTALSAARDCKAARSWCLLLEGYANNSTGNVAAADTAFMRAARVMKPDERCQWTSIAPLLDTRSRAAYERIDCSARDTVNATFWWLADPMYIEPGNARRAEHFARKVMVALHAGLTHDERWDWREKYGGDALATMIVRYGWPSYMYWAGYREDGGHFEWLGFRDSSINIAPEYALPRFTTTPPWRAVLDPSTLTSADWARFSPRAGYGDIEWEGDSWPQESISRTNGPLIEVPEQMVMFRRDNDALLAVGLDVPQRYFRPGATISYDAAIVAARGPTDRWVPSRTSLVIDGRETTVLVSPLSARAQIVSAELAPADGAYGLAVRARRAIHAPQPLSVLQPGEIAISDPLFFHPDSAADPPMNVGAAVPMMLGSLNLAQSRVGVFWETYGASPADTIETTLRVSNSGKPGFFRRLGTTIGIASDIRGEIAVRWREPRDARRDGLSWAGDVPIQGRGVVLDLSRMRSGRYTVEITVARNGSAPVSTKRDVTIGK